MELQLSANDASFASQRARSVPVLSSMSTIRGYPTKLKIFRISGSRFWQVRCYVAGRMYVRSTRSQEKQDAIDAAKQFYDELLLNHRHGEEREFHLPSRNRRAELVQSYAGLMFRTVAERAIEMERGRVMRGELAMQSLGLCATDCKSRFIQR